MRIRWRRALVSAGMVAATAIVAKPVIGQERHVVQQAQVTILSSNLANGNTVGEWGLSAFVEADGVCVLFDAGRHPETVVHNARELGIDLGCVSDVVLSHFHSDHTAGLNALIDTLRPDHPNAIRRVHVAAGFFESRRVPPRGDGEANQMIAARTELEARGVEFLVHEGAAEIAPGIWLTGPVPRTTPEKTYPAAIKIERDGEWVDDYVPESQGLSVLTPEGHIVILGCGHSGVVNLLTHVQETIADRPIHALMGGLHLFNATDETLGWTADRLRDIGVHHLMAGHCTGIEPLFRLRAGLNLTRRTAVVGAVGSRFVLGEGIQPTVIAM
ncbi:MAG: MBL fold metallo-hydrolase [Acidobacteria bacterium]|nr:MBL fold metallo-hydrolase [Acidobacteriota bacterium]